MSDESFMQYLSNRDSLEYVTCDKVDAEPEEDGLDGLRHLTFEETKGERYIREIPSK